MNAYGTGMNPYMFNHFLRVARNMNNYVAAASHGYHQSRRHAALRDRGNYWSMYARPSPLQAGAGGLLAYGLHAIGLPTSLVYLGYRVGNYIDRIA